MTNHFQEGGDTYRAWTDSGCLCFDIPDNPYPEHSVAYGEWEVGFDDAMEYQLHGQYQDFE